LRLKSAVSRIGITFLVLVALIVAIGVGVYATSQSSRNTTPASLSTAQSLQSTSLTSSFSALNSTTVTNSSSLIYNETITTTETSVQLLGCTIGSVPVTSTVTNTTFSTTYTVTDTAGLTTECGYYTHTIITTYVTEG
jgi:uncharacterized protein (UPF0333 family)